jgi:DNA-binding MarR family transcriptional regulator
MMSGENLDTAVTDFGYAIGLLLRHVRTATATHDLSLTEAALLTGLDRHGQATTADLARAGSVRPQSMRTTIAALEQMEYVKRKPHTTDGRQIIIELTAKGFAVRKSSKDAKRTWLANAILRLDRQEQVALFAAGEIIKRLVEI